MIRNFQGQLNQSLFEKLYALDPISLIDTCQLKIATVIESYEPRFKADIFTFCIWNIKQFFVSDYG